MDQITLYTKITDKTQHKTNYTEWNNIWTWNRKNLQEIWWWNKGNCGVQLTSTYSTLAVCEGAFLSTRHSNTSTLADVTVPLMILARDFLFSLPSTITGAASSLSQRNDFTPKCCGTPESDYACHLHNILAHSMYLGLLYTFHKVKGKKVKLFLPMPWGHIGGVESHSFLTFALDGEQWSTYAPVTLTRERTVVQI